MKHYLIETFTAWHGTDFLSFWADDKDHAMEQCREEMENDWGRDWGDIEIVSMFISDTEITRV